MKILLKSIFVFVFYFAFCISPSYSQGNCLPYTSVDVPGAQPSNPTTVINNNCSSACLSNTACNGFTQSGSNCLLNVGNANDINYQTPNSTVYTAIVRSSSCNAAQNCAYNWNGRKFTYGNGGKQIDNKTLNDCIMWCQTNDICVGFDWDSKQNTCWIFNFTGAATAPNDVIYHFDKSCLPTSVSTTVQMTPPVTTLPATSVSSISTQSSSSTSKPSSSTTVTLPPNSTVASSTSTKTSSVTASSTVISSSATSFPTPSSTSSTASPCPVTCSSDKVCNSSGQCVCNTDCPPDVSPVCGNDNVTYDNACKFMSAKCLNQTNATDFSAMRCGSASYSSEDNTWYPLAIKPAYIVLAGIGGGCLLLVLTAVIILCGYSMNGEETYSAKGTLVAQNRSQVVQEQIGMEAEGGNNVEFNPYYNRTELDAPDFSKDENIM